MENCDRNEERRVEEFNIRHADAREAGETGFMRKRNAWTQKKQELLRAIKTGGCGDPLKDNGIEKETEAVK